MSLENQEKDKGIGFFEKYLTLWVAVCMVIGVLIGKYLPALPEALSKIQVEGVSIPVTILIWLMIYPMMVKIDFNSIVKAIKTPKGLIVTCSTNWLISPFSMYAIMSFFMFVVYRNIIPNDLAKQYLAGGVLLASAPCTAMVFVWSKLSNGNPAYTLVQVAINDIILLFAFTPIVGLLLGISGIEIPWGMLLLSVVLYVVLPLAAGAVTRKVVLKNKGEEYLNNVFIKKFDGITTIGLLLTLIITLSFQGEIILKNPMHIVLLIIPMVIQTFFIFFIAYGWSKLWKLPHNVAAPAGMIGASNFFELAVAVAVSLFGLDSGATLTTVVGVLVEVPVMLTLVRIANNTKGWFQTEPIEK
ncbi:ACR3 family arsenite efflux transporter [Terrisporobacter glycolicus]|uniref:ACR3 family arsenite efflux transporter n=1 Tax=Terrisporobacter glycolicus TaxID=36841 RepID=UPI003463DAA4